MTNNVGAVFDAGHQHFDALTTSVWEPVGRATVAISRPAAGERVLDACCGAGASAIPAASAVGPDGHVDGVDLSERLLDLGRSRARDLPQLTFRAGDVTSWPFGPYDLVQCVLGIFFLPDMTAGGKALVGLLRPGGRFAVTVWREDAASSVGRHLTAAATPEGASTAVNLPARMNTSEALTDLLYATGVRDVRIHEVPQSVHLEPGMAWDLVLGSGMRRQLSALDADAVERVRQRFFAGWDVDAVDISVLVGVGHKPA